MDNLIERARTFAARAHDGQVRRYTGEPYVVHCEAVAQLLIDHGLPAEVVAAGYLHDTMEDCGVTCATLKATFGMDVAYLVSEVTDVSRREDGNRAVRKAIDRGHLAQASPGGQSIKLADLIDNTKSIVAHDPKFARVYLAEKRALLEVLTRGHGVLHQMAMRLLESSEWQLAPALPCVLHGPLCQLYRRYHVFFEPKSGPTRLHDWTAVHEEYDGPGDNRVIYAATLADALARVDEMEEGR